MTDTNVPNALEMPAQAIVPVIEQGQARLSQLLAGLEQATPAAEEGVRSNEDARFENQLALVRLGMATSLFYAMRTKHAPTAAHSLRVALVCSAWASRLGIEADARDRIEVAALLHDLGKIGIPDRILRKPGKLTVDEQLTMDCCPELGCEILRGCTSDPELLNIVRYANTWFDSRRQDEGPRGDALPIGSRMLAIAGAFDAMTTDSVYRTAMSRERAVSELIEGSGTQFDPELALDFARMLDGRPEMLQVAVVDRWLKQLQSNTADCLWRPTGETGIGQSHVIVRRESRFFQQLAGHLKDGVVFTDGEGTIIEWNMAMQELTGITAEAIVGQSWSDECLRFRDKDGTRFDGCLVKECLHSSATTSRRMQIEQMSGEPTPVNVLVSPVVSDVPGTLGTVVIVQDLSDQADLEEKLETLHHKTTLDPLTGIANRAHFDDTLQQLTAATAAGGASFALIICDIDHFKRVNDVHGHPAGDEALISFASILSGHSREGDLVARYGGEEFLLLAANCDNATATKRAEAIRVALENTPLPSIGGESVTASFGVTEYQSGDAAETVLARADRALLKAKDNGRNRVVQLGAGHQPSACETTPKRSWLRWFESSSDEQADSRFCMVTPVPVDLAIEKLRGFIADHNAEIIHVTENQVSMKVTATCTIGGRRRVDQRIDLNAQLTLRESTIERSADDTRPQLRNTTVYINLSPIRNRDRRSRELTVCIDQVVASLRSYLMGEMVPLQADK